MAANDPRIKTAVGVVPVVDGYNNMRRVHGETRFRDFENAILADRRERAKTGGGGNQITFATKTPDEVLSVWPLARVNEVFNELKLTEAPLHEHWSTLESAELLLDYSVFPFLGRILDKKVLMIVAEADNITALDLEIQAFNKIASPFKHIEILPSVSHMSFYSEKADTNTAAKHTRDWYAASFKK